MDTQQLIAIAIALVAGAWLLRRSVISLRSGKPGCGTCDGCPEEESTTMPVRKRLYSLGDPDQ